MITKYGYTTIGIVAVICFIFISASFFINIFPIKFFIILFAILLIGFTINFFRDPEREIPPIENVIISPADGKIILIKDINENKFLKDNARQISIFMSPLNVHVNRIPIDGVIEYLQYHEGKYLVAYDDKASELNERSEIGINSKLGKVLFTQIAGFVARRIIYDLKIGDNVKKGNRFGMIKFGSRVDVIVDKRWKVKVKNGDKVFAGETILFELNN